MKFVHIRISLFLRNIGSFTFYWNKFIHDFNSEIILNYLVSGKSIDSKYHWLISTAVNNSYDD